MRIPVPAITRRARIEIIPLIDIMFFLLATFVMVSLSMVRNQGIPVRLPAAASGVALERKSYVAITVSELGDYYFDKELITLEEVVQRLRERHGREPELRVFINGDARANFESVVAVLDETRRLGITKVSIETTRKP
jgi:biopolymer transport protein ExbD